MSHFDSHPSEKKLPLGLQILYPKFGLFNEGTGIKPRFKFLTVLIISMPEVMSTALSKRFIKGITDG